MCNSENIVCFMLISLTSVCMFEYYMVYVYICIIPCHPYIESTNPHVFTQSAMKTIAISLSTVVLSIQGWQWYLALYNTF